MLGVPGLGSPLLGVKVNAMGVRRHHDLAAALDRLTSRFPALVAAAAALGVVAGCAGGLVCSPQTPETIGAQATQVAEALGTFDATVCFGPVRLGASGEVVAVGADPLLDRLIDEIAARLTQEGVAVVPPSASRSALSGAGRAPAALLAGETGEASGGVIRCPVVLLGEVVEDRLHFSTVRTDSAGPGASAVAWLVWKRREARVAFFAEAHELLGSKERGPALINYLRRHPGRVTQAEFRDLLEACGSKDRAPILEMVEDERLLFEQRP